MYHLLRNTRLSSLAYAIVSVDNRLTYVTNEVLATKHDCLYGENVNIYAGAGVFSMRVLNSKKKRLSD